eukprot:760752-Pyramimonas_sp.AAC.1
MQTFLPNLRDMDDLRRLAFPLPMGLGDVKVASRWPREPQEGHKRAPRRPTSAQERPKTAPRHHF